MEHARGADNCLLAVSPAAGVVKSFIPAGEPGWCLQNPPQFLGYFWETLLWGELEREASG